MTMLIEKLSAKAQKILLQRCISKQIPLSSELHKRGLTYDHLCYLRNDKNDFPSLKYKNIENCRQVKHRIPAVSFFSGAGGLDIGFDYAGFNNLASVEYNELFCKTLRLNFPEHLVIGPPDYSGNIKNKEEIATVLKTMLNISPPFEGVFHGGPPCQPFSIAANQRFAKTDSNFKRRGFNDDKQGNLLNDYIWIIAKFRPKVFLIENVPGLLEIDKGRKLMASLSKLRKIGYCISEPKIINASHYGVPQKRLRLIIVGTRDLKVFEFPEADSLELPCFNVFENPIHDEENHITREHSAKSILRYMQLDFGQRDHLGRVDRLNPFLPSKTVIAGGTKGGGRSHLHPYSPRTLSVRECARIQTFPENYIFVGPVARQFTQVGNAVPPMLGCKIATQIYKQYFT